MAGPTDLEQLELEYINEARLDPLRNAARYISGYGTVATSNDAQINSALRYFNVSGSAYLSALQALTPVQPVAWNEQLAAAALGHNQAMIAADVQSHQVSGEPDLGARLRNAGYTFSTGGENIYAYAESALYAHAGFMVDWGNGPDGMQAGAGHRVNIMSSSYRELGVVITPESNSATQVGPLVVTQDFGSRSGLGQLVLGVAYADRNGDNFYSVGEGVGTLTVALGTASVTSFASGGYTLQTSASGAQAVTFSGGGLATAVTATLALATNGNVKVDIVDGTRLKSSTDVTVGGPITILEALGVGAVALTASGSGAHTLLGAGGANRLTGGSGVDTLTGGAGVDTLTGGAGADVFRDTAAGLNGDTITDFALGDRIVISDATLAGFQFSVSGSTLTYTGGSVTLSGVPAGYRFAAAAAAGGGVELSATISGRAVQNDFNGDGRSDIVWRNDNGAFTDWLGQPSGGFALNDGAAYTTVPLAWKVAGVGDFNGDGRADVLWRNDNGALTDWLGQANGAFALNDTAAYAQVSLDWKVAGVGDFNGDGRADILWRNDNGALTDWLGQANGGFAINNAAYTTAPTSWKVAGVGDFNGDGRDDILWRNDNGALTNWLGQANGSFALNDAAAYATVPTDWRVAGVGDFNGDGRDDILWRNDNGALTDWLGQANGGFAINNAAYTTAPTAWKVANVGDYNGDGRDDILWRNDNGALTDWLGQANGSFALNDAAAFTTVPTAWKVADTRALLGAPATGGADGTIAADRVFEPAHATLDDGAAIAFMGSRFDHIQPVTDPVW